MPRDDAAEDAPYEAGEAASQVESAGTDEVEGAPGSESAESPRKRACRLSYDQPPSTQELSRTHATLCGEATRTSDAPHDDDIGTPSLADLEAALTRSVRKANELELEKDVMTKSRDAALAQAKSARDFQLQLSTELSECKTSLEASESLVRGLSKTDEKKSAIIDGLKRTTQAHNKAKQDLQATIDTLRGEAHRNGQARVQQSQKKWTAWTKAGHPVILDQELILVSKYDDKDLLNSMGAAFVGGRWRVPRGVSLRPFAYWLPDPPPFAGIPSASHGGGSSSASS